MATRVSIQEKPLNRPLLHAQELGDNSKFNEDSTLFPQK